jgi:hypothetical protein
VKIGHDLSFFEWIHTILRVDMLNCKKIGVKGGKKNVIGE